MESEKLNMTIEEMEEEILCMRNLEKYMQKTLGEEEYDFIVRGFAREKAKEQLMELGASEEVADNIIENMDIQLKCGTKKM